MHRVIITLSLVFISLNIKAQDPLFSQSLGTALYQNPALTGSNGCARLASTFKDKIIDSKQYKNFYVSYDQFINKLGGGLGFYYLLNENGAGVKSNMMHLAGSYGIKLMENKVKIIPGIDFGFVNQLFDSTGLHLDANKVITKLNYADINVGLQALGKKFNFGLVVNHINQANISTLRDTVMKLGMKYTVNGDFTIGKVDEKRTWKITPGVWLQNQNSKTNVMGSLSVIYHKIKFGVAYRSTNDALFQLAYQGWLFKFRYTYDLATKKVAGAATPQTHEVATVWSLFKKKKKDDFLELNNLGF